MTSLITNSELDEHSFVCVLKDSYGAFVYWNAALEAIFRLPDDGMSGKTEYHFMPDDDAAAIRNNDQNVLSTGNQLRALERTTMHDGTTATWLVYKFRVVARDLRFLAVIGSPTVASANDIDEQIARMDSELLRNLEACRHQLERIAGEYVATVGAS